MDIEFMGTMLTQRQQAEARAYLRKLFPEAKVAITLTFKPKAIGGVMSGDVAGQLKREFGTTLTGAAISKDVAANLTCEFLHRLNNHVYRRAYRRHERHLASVFVTEGDGGFSAKATHVHVTLERPIQYDFPAFKRLCIGTWYGVADICGGLDFQPADDGWIDYITKFQTKTGSLLDNLHIDPVH